MSVAAADGMLIVELPDETIELADAEARISIYPSMATGAASGWSVTITAGDENEGTDVEQWGFDATIEFSGPCTPFPDRVNRRRPLFEIEGEFELKSWPLGWTLLATPRTPRISDAWIVLTEASYEIIAGELTISDVLKETQMKGGDDFSRYRPQRTIVGPVTVRFRAPVTRIGDPWGVGGDGCLSE